MATKILLIEDNPDIRENTQELLELSDYEVEVAENGKEGVKKAKDLLPDLIVCDIMMPELDGYGVLNILNKNPQTASIPFIFLTAKAEKDDFRKGMTLGADDYLTKPFDETDLLNAIENRLRKYNLFKQNFEQSTSGLNNFISLAKNEADISSLTENKKTQNYRSKEIIFREGEYPTKIYFVNKGKVKIYKINEDGKEYITKLVVAGEYFGLTPILNNTEYEEWAESIQDVEVVTILKEEFLDLLHSNKDVANKFIQILSNNVSEREEKLLHMAYDTVRKRVVDALVMVSQNAAINSEGRKVLNLPREDLAQLVGTAKETTIRVLSDLKKDGIIKTEGSKIFILNEKSLKNIRF